MCKSRAPLPQRQTGNKEENVNLGLLNISSNLMSWLSMETILEIVTVLILILLVLRWIKKYHTKKKAEKLRKLTSIIRPSQLARQTSFVQELPMGFISDLPTTSDIQTTRALTHNKQHVNDEREESPIGLPAFRM